MQRTTSWSEAITAVLKKKASPHVAACFMYSFYTRFSHQVLTRFLTRFSHQVPLSRNLCLYRLYIISQGFSLTRFLSRCFSLTRFSHQVPFSRNFCLYIGHHLTNFSLRRFFSHQVLSPGFPFSRNLFVYIYIYRLYIISHKVFLSYKVSLTRFFSHQVFFSKSVFLSHRVSSF